VHRLKMHLVSKHTAVL